MYLCWLLLISLLWIFFQQVLSDYSGYEERKCIHAILNLLTISPHFFASLLLVKAAPQWKKQTGRGQVNSHYRDMSARRPHVYSRDIAWKIGSVLLHMHCKAHMGPKKNSHPLAWLAVSSLLKRKKNRNIIASYKSYHSALLPLTPQSVRSLWCLSSRWNVLVSPMWWTEETLREEEMCPPPSIKCARVHSTTTHREEGRGLQGHLWGRFRTGSNSVCFTHVLSKWVRWQDGEFYVWY